MDILRQSLKTGRQADRIAAALSLIQPHALVVGDWEQVTPLWYAQQVNGWCLDCLIRASMDDLDNFARQAQAEARPLYVARTVNQASDWSEPTAEGPLVHLAVVPNSTLPRNLTPLNLKFDRDLRLAGYLWPLGLPTFRAGHALPISLVWEGGDKPSPDYAISLRLTGASGEIWKEDIAAPVLGMHPFSRLETGQVIADYHEIPRRMTCRSAVIFYRWCCTSLWRTAALPMRR